MGGRGSDEEEEEEAKRGRDCGTSTGKRMDDDSANRLLGERERERAGGGRNLFPSCGEEREGEVKPLFLCLIQSCYRSSFFFLKKSYIVK